MSNPFVTASAALLRAVVSWSEAVVTHPLSSACIAIAVVVMTIMNFGVLESFDHTLIVLMCAAISGFFGTLALELDLRRSFPVRRMRVFFGLILMIAIGGVLWPIPTAEMGMLYPATIWIGSMAILLIAVAFRLPFEMDRPGSDLLAWYSGQRFVLGSALGVALSVVLAAGISGALLAAEELLEVNVAGEIYAQVWIVALALIAPMSVMVEAEQALPVNTKKRPPAPQTPPRWLAIVVGWVMIPLSVVYMVILYLYLGKLAMEGQMPAGMIAPISAAYLAFGAVTHLAALPLHHADRPVATWFRRIFPVTMLLPLGALAWAWQVRVDAYGLTEPRFLLALVAGWLLLLALIWIPGSRRVAPSRLPAILGVMLLVVGGGPWGAVASSLSSQREQLWDLLRANDMLTEEQVPEEDRQPGQPMVIRTALPIPDGTLPSAEDQRRMMDILEYFDSRGQTGYLAAMFPQEAGDGAADADDAPNAYSRADYLKLDPSTADSLGRELILVLETARSGLSTTGFSSMVQVSVSPESAVAVDTDEGLTLVIDGMTLGLLVPDSDAPVAVLDLAPMVEAILAGQEIGLGQEFRDVSPDRLVAEAAGETWRMRLLADRLIVVQEEGERHLRRVSGMLLLGKQGP